MNIKARFISAMIKAISYSLYDIDYIDCNLQYVDVLFLLVYIRHAIKRLKATFYPVTVNERLAITKPQRNGEYQKGRVALDRALATDIESNGFKMKTCKYFTDGYKVGAHFW